MEVQNGALFSVILQPILITHIGCDDLKARIGRWSATGGSRDFRKQQAKPADWPVFGFDRERNQPHAGLLIR